MPTSPEPRSDASSRFSGLPRRYAGSSAEERLAQRRERLLAAAFDVFGRNGHANATLRLICASARMTERYFYECFGSLDEAFRIVHDRLASELVMQVAASLPAGATGDSITLARGALRVFFDYIKSDPRRARILLLDAMVLGLTNPYVEHSKARWYAELIKTRLQARYTELPEDFDAELIASGFLGQVIHTATVWAQRNFDTPVERMVDHTVYGWIGLHQWLSGAAIAPQAGPQAGPQTNAPEAPAAPQQALLRRPTAAS